MGTCSRRSSVSCRVFVLPDIQCPEVLEVDLSQSEVVMRATLRELPARCRELRAEPFLSPSPNRPGECQTDTGCKPVVAVVALSPVLTRGEKRSRSPARLRRLLLG